MVKGEWMNVRRTERGSLLGIKIYSPIYECFIECVDIPEHGARMSYLKEKFFFRLLENEIQSRFQISTSKPRKKSALKLLHVAFELTGHVIIPVQTDDDIPHRIKNVTLPHPSTPTVNP